MDNICEICNERIIMGKNYFMVTNELWNKHRNNKDILCLSCFEKNLGRQLTLGDLTLVRVNATLLHHLHLDNLYLAYELYSKTHTKTEETIKENP